MEINLLITEDNTVVVAIQGYFQKPLKAILFGPDDHFLTLCFHHTQEKETLDCPIDEDIAKVLHEQDFCCVGFFQDATLFASQVVPLVEKEGVVITGVAA